MFSIFIYLLLIKQDKNSVKYLFVLNSFSQSFINVTKVYIQYKFLFN